MGIYINPGNHAFSEINDSDYVDKTGLIDLVNQTIGRKNKLTCISRPRRFGKSYAAKMLTAYYDCSCDSGPLFDDKIIAQTKDYRTFLNRFNVICLDITSFTSAVKKKNGSLAEIPSMIEESILKELPSIGFHVQEGDSLQDSLLHYIDSPDGKPFIFIIDEWDAVIREAKNDPAAQEAYLNLLRGWFKNTNFTPRAVAAAYITGILPIKKDGSQSAISDFDEYSMLRPLQFSPYVGFTEKEVQSLCEKHNVSFDMMKHWYDGYSFKKTGSVYNPNSVMKAIQNEEFDSYWTETSAAEGLLSYISQSFNGLTRTIAELIGGVETALNPTGFANDLTTFRGKDDVLTLMVHLGYLAYNSETKTVRIPNEEVRLEFQKAIRESDHEETRRRVSESDQLFLDTVQGHEKAVAAQIEKIHREETSPLHYNREDSLRSVIKLAYYTYRDHYVQFEELPGGEGYADVVYLPKNGSAWPVLVIELKWNNTADGAISQILHKNYPEPLKNYGNRILLIAISYERDLKAGGRRHTCRIMEYRKI